MKFGSALNSLLDRKSKAIVRLGKKREITIAQCANRDMLMIENKYPYIPSQDDIFATDWSTIK